MRVQMLLQDWHYVVYLIKWSGGNDEQNSMDKTGVKYVLRDPALHYIVTSLY